MSTKSILLIEDDPLLIDIYTTKLKEVGFKVEVATDGEDGLRKANSVLLEPIMDLEVVTPPDYLSQVIGDLNSRRSKIVSITERKSIKVVRTEAPLREVFNYADILRNLTQGRGSYTMEPYYYDQVPADILVKILGI